MTYRDRLINGLTEQGWKLVPAQTTKYKVFKKDGHDLMFVGKMGALRMGRTATTSFSIGDPSNLTPAYKAIIGEVA
jgi:hypothetical protein